MALNYSYNSCDDFYSFVSSTFQGATHVFKKLEYRIRRENAEVLFKTRVPPSGQNAAQKAAAMFKGCVQIASSANNSQVEALRPLFRNLDLDVSNMPSDLNFDVVDRMSQLSFVYGLPALVEFAVYHGMVFPVYVLLRYHSSDEAWIINNYVFAESDDGQAGFYGSLIHLYDPSLDNFAFGKRILQAEHVVRLFVEKNKKHYNTISTTVSKLFNYTPDSVSKDRWEEMITTYSNHTFNASTSVLVLHNMTAIVELLMDNTRMARDDSRLLVAWCVLHRLLTIAHGKELMRRATERYYKKPDAVNIYCYEEILAIMELAVTTRYLRMKDMIRALQRKIHSTDWFKDPLRTLALREARNFKLVLGYPKELYNKSEVEALFADYPDVDGDFVTAFLKIKRLLIYREMRGNGTKKLEITIPNASYQSARHLITVNAGILHPPFYTAGAPAAMNYGTIGQILAHEVMHAYDVIDITKDHRGFRITKNVSNTMVEYEKRVLSLHASFQRAESESRARSMNNKIDSEGLADYGGILLAYDAFRHLPPETRAETVPAFGLSAEQTFFVAHCIKWCQEDKNSRLRESGGLYQRWRCIVPLQNMPEFAEAFNCKLGNYMNPEEKCEFWQRILAHEVMHAYDVIGITKDHRGFRITKNVSNTMVEYEERVLCLRASFQRAESESRARSMNNKIYSEGLADYGGILLAYDAFRHLPPETRAETVPAVGLSAEQTFFVAHCIKWCQEDKTSRVRDSGGLYWNQRSRCIVPLQNMPEFAEAFNCKLGNYMNPEEKCEFWQRA